MSAEDDDLKALKAATVRVTSWRDGALLGTGFLVGANGDLLLTCAHVVGEETRVGVLLEGKQTPRVGDVRVVVPEANTDAALVQLEEPLEGVEPLVLSRHPVSAGNKVRMVGYPEAAKACLTFEGRIKDRESRDDKGRPGLAIYSDQFAAGGGADLHGLSGGPVATGRRVVGQMRRVITEDGRAEYGQAWASSVEDFVGKFGDFESSLWRLEPEHVGASRETLVKEIAKRLTGERNEVLREKLGVKLKRGIPFQKPKDIAGALIDRTPYDLLTVVNGVARDLVGDGSEGSDPESDLLAESLAVVAEIGLAAALDLTAVQGIVEQAGAGMWVVELPCAEETIAELYNARLDGRRPKLSFRPCVSAGERRIPASPPVGMDVDGSRKVQTILEDLARAVLTAIFRSKEKASLARNINEALSTLAEQEPKTRWYFLYVANEDRDAAEELKRLLPELRVCRLEVPESPAVRERREVRLVTALNVFFGWKTKLAEKRESRNARMA